MSLCRAIANIVDQRRDTRRVACVRIDVGHFRQVVPDTLSFCWSVLRDQSGLEGCELVINHVPAVIECDSCSGTTTLDVPVLVCANCSGTDVRLVSGEEFMIESIELAEEVS